ncbi:magnesium transporter [Thermoactinomyces sp. DSM 45892]|uniref:magnesium transporter n=1 Tax=Thermoactinomyces sp. DSM 45892 TaxID=1882753 RepID=UPI00089D44E2|nr:magnesium transporter [Thermoactinomyces sp. DSM 45892]SDZ13628.1 magnesium transporter [Thermoactinomyces sp. DSM 45892]
MDYNFIQNRIQTVLDTSPNSTELLEIIQPLQPYDISQVISHLEGPEQLKLIPSLPIPMAAESIEYLEPEVQYNILQHLDNSISSLLLKQMSSDAVVDTLLAIHPYQAERLLRLLSEEYRLQINKLMSYPEYTAGSLMTVDYISARAYWSCDRTLEHIRKVGHEAEIVSYIYVTNVRGELVGVASLKEIILASRDTTIGAIATAELISAPAEMEQEEVAKILSRYDLYALPVVDTQKRLVGIITHDDVVDVLEEEATEDFQKLGGSQPLEEPYFKATVWNLYSKRIIWLLILFAGGAYTSTVIESYQSALNQVVALSFFIPLLTGTGGNTGSQIVTTLVRALGVGEVHFSDVFRVIRKELITGSLIGVSLGIIALARSWMMGVDINVTYVVAVSALCIVLWSSLVSSFLPLMLHRLKIDPAVVSGPLITTLVDGTGLIIYFTMAQIILHI